MDAWLMGWVARVWLMTNRGEGGWRFGLKVLGAEGFVPWLRVRRGVVAPVGGIGGCRTGKQIGVKSVRVVAVLARVPVPLRLGSSAAGFGGKQGAHRRVGASWFAVARELAEARDAGPGSDVGLSRTGASVCAGAGAFAPGVLWARAEKQRGAVDGCVVGRALG